jgi:DNA-binding CsgD family transcriptional regulator
MINALSDAERSVVRLVLERRSNAEIARIRTTSARTVANQLSMVLHKLKVNGRSGILCRLIAAARAANAAPSEGWPEATDSRFRKDDEAYVRSSGIELPDSYAGLGRAFAVSNRVQFPHSTRTG